MRRNQALISTEGVGRKAVMQRINSIRPVWRLAHTRRAGPWSGAAVRVTFGLIWLVDAVLKWLPTYRTNFLEQLRAGAQGQPQWLHPWFHFVVGLASPRSTLFAHATAIIETLLAFALIAGFARKFTYVGGAAYSLLVFLALLVVNARSGTSRYSLDRLIERRWAWWHRLAEIGPLATVGGAE